MSCVASKVRKDIQDLPEESTLTADAETNCIPASLYLRLDWIFTGCTPKDGDDLDIHWRIPNTGETVLLHSSRGEKHTPKQVAMGMYVHNIIQSRDLGEISFILVHSTFNPCRQEVRNSKLIYSWEFYKLININFIILFTSAINHNVSSSVAVSLWFDVHQYWYIMLVW